MYCPTSIKISMRFTRRYLRKSSIPFRWGYRNWEYKKLGSLYENNNERNVDLIGFERTISSASMSFKDEGNGVSEKS